MIYLSYRVKGDVRVKKMHKGQSAIEYVLLAACVIAVMIVFLSPGGRMQTKVNSTIIEAVGQIGTMAEHTNFATGETIP